jgi:hypothetical protein
MLNVVMLWVNMLNAIMLWFVMLSAAFNSKDKAQGTRFPRIEGVAENKIKKTFEVLKPGDRDSYVSSIFNKFKNIIVE